MLKRLANTVLILIAAASFALAQEANYQGLHYTTPPGWVSGEQQGQFILAPSDMTDDTAVVVVLYGAERLSGRSFQDWLKARMASGTNSQVKVLQDSPVQSGAAGNLQTLSTGRTVQDATGGVRLQIFYAISDGKQAAAAMLITASEAAANKYMPAIQGLFGSMNLGGRPAAPGPEPAPAPAPAKPGSTAPASPPSSAASGGARTFQNVIYTPPNGWSAQENAGGVALSPQGGLQGNETLTLVILPGKVGANLEQEFQTTWLEVCAMLNSQSMRTVNGGMYDLQGIGRSASGWEFLRGEGGARNDQQRFTVSLFLVKVNERIERVAIIARELQVNLTVANAASNPRFYGAINEFLFGLRFANWKTPDFAAAKLTGGAVTGVWGGISMFGGQFKTGTAAFFSDGSAWFGSGFPTHGLAGVKPHIESGADRRRWGKYKFAGSTGVLTMPYGEIPLRLEATGLVLTTNNTPHKFIRSHMPTSPALNGRYCFGDGSACITFSSNGQFQDQGAARVLEHALYPYPLTPTSGQGQYEIRDYTLILRYSGGPEVRVAFPGFYDSAAAQSPSPADIVLSFNFDKLKRM